MSSTPTLIDSPADRIGMIRTRPSRDGAAELLPFRVRIVRNEEQLSKAVDIRAEAYERHWPSLSLRLQRPEEQDRNPNSLIFLAESKESNSPMGTMRVDTNLVTSLQVARDIKLPEAIGMRTMAYVTRLGVKQGSLGSLVKLALFKSLHRYCLAKQLHWLIVGVKPPNDRDYVRLGFSDIFEEGQLTPITSSGGVPVRLMSFEVISAERRWYQSSHPLYKFMFTDYHPDIEVFSSVSGMWSRPRQSTPKFTEAVSIFDELGLPLI